ncbi:ABC transporter-like protein [Gloeomargarita lithophora Alchichica-D10]|uniref:ABC transporter-like protein n=1 Tax=Gloeomargarita lithophora Alchichica-D10 TaxID=1188229 RepID=A0A1J0ADJ7_9CYAN|nr:metal ABC transporter ATP-binding protein [Gloeomargarita lithophora]APB34010.1 ABC transporter-like protein [Gloeomargarita lithophora Alchichica-D10]
MLVVESLSAGYPGRPVLAEVSFTLAPQEMVGLVGPNGAGKSTLLKALLGLLPQVSGRVWLELRPLLHQRQRVAYIPQRSEIDWDYPITVEQVVRLGCGGRRSPQVLSTLERLGLLALRRRRIGALSGGQQQRVFLARALVQGADVFCLDEPLTGVDAHAEQVILDVLTELRQNGAMILVSTHHWGEFLQQMNRVMLLNQRLIAVGTPQEVMTPEFLQHTYAKNPSSFNLERQKPPLFC